MIRIQPHMVHRGTLILVNSEHPFKQPIHSRNLASVEDIMLACTKEHNMRLERKCLQQLELLLTACGGEKEIGIVSGYRTRLEQKRIYDQSYVENGPIFTASYVARPDESEHQTGLAVDVGELKEGVDYLCPSFPGHGVYADFRRMAAEYGFIQRYQQGKEHLTHIACEPWHFRYVGVPHSIIMNQYGICLEEYIGYIQQFTLNGSHLFKKHKDHLIEMYFVEMGKEEKEIAINIDINPGSWVEVSGNNVNGCIVTIFHNQGQASR
jgi:D-alanyl-D-alanine dipeptidase/carboxypeptidase